MIYTVKKKAKRFTLDFYYRLRVLILPASLICLLLTAQAQASPLPPKKSDGLFLKQVSKRYGSISSFIAEGRGFRMDAMGIKIFCVAPYKKVSMYNDSTRSYYSTTVDELGNRLNLLKLTDSEKARGIKMSIKKLSPGKFQNLALENTIWEKFDKHKKPVLLVGSTHDLKLSKPLEDAACRLTSCPSGYGLPINVYMWTKGVREPLLVTTKVDPWKFAPRVFAEPKGYKKVADEMELMMESDELKSF